MTLNPWILAGLLGAFLLSNAITGTVAYEKGKHKAELTCAKADSEALAAGIDKWKNAADAQRDIDQLARNGDALRAKAAAEQAQAVADRFERMKIAIIKVPPVGKCDLSPAWLEAFNAAK